LKPVQVELTLKGRQLGQLEVMRQQFHELLGLVDDEAPSVGLPRDDVFVSVRDHLLKHVVQLQWKRYRHASACRCVLLIIHTVIVGMVVVIVLNDDMRVDTGRRLFFLLLLLLFQTVLRFCFCCCAVLVVVVAAAVQHGCGNIVTTAFKAVRWEGATVTNVGNTHDDLFVL
jgi:hypothetical protein